MLTALRFTVLLAGGLALAVWSLPAQTPQDGDCAVLGHQVGPVAVDVSWIRHDGTTGGALFGSSAHSGGGGLTAAPLNDGVLFTAMRNLGGTSPQLFQVDKFAMLTTIGNLPAPLGFLPTLLVDQTGDLLVLSSSTSAAAGGVFRIPMGSTQLSTLVSGIVNAVAMEEDLATGDLLVADLAGDVHRVTRSGTVSSITRGAFPAVAGVRSKMHTFFRDGTVIATWGNQVCRFDPRSGTTTTLVLGGSATYIGLDHDPIHGQFYRGDSSALVRYDPGSGFTALLRQWPSLFSVSDVATWGSRALTGQGAPRPGAAFPIHLGLFSESGRAYQVACSFGTRPGIVTPAGRIPLNLDDLLFLSLANPAVFQGFSGRLSRSGTARLTVALPNIAGLRGLRFFVAAITYDAAGVRRISEPLGVLIE
ncbi:MAG: hypothetical protein JXQ29_07505 [Planctomycetes bacterium]|nr:hypothetical protein [Planctomycetota bacterium]